MKLERTETKLNKKQNKRQKSDGKEERCHENAADTIRRTFWANVAIALGIHQFISLPPRVHLVDDCFWLDLLR